jgi:hypothetical protein
MSEQDVKETTEEVVEDQESSTEELNEFDELFGVSEDTGKIPYNRFKQVNDEKNELKEQVNALKASVDAQIAEAVRNAKLDNLVNKPADEIEEFTFEDNSSKEINELKAMIEKQANELRGMQQETRYKELSSQIKTLKTSFPEMDEDTVLAYKQKRPDLPLEELAKYSHDRNRKKIEDAVTRILNEKKEAAKQNKVIGKEALKAFASKETKERGSLQETEDAIRRAFASLKE